MEFLVVIVWLICGLIAASVMSGKGRSGLGGLALGVLLGPIGVIIALVIRPSEESEAARQIRIEQLKREMSKPTRPAQPTNYTRSGKYIRNNTTLLGTRYRWECHNCGKIGQWVRREREVERQAQAHQCDGAVVRM